MLSRLSDHGGAVMADTQRQCSGHVQLQNSYGMTVIIDKSAYCATVLNCEKFSR